jgi:predicted nucleic acid-binding protein
MGCLARADTVYMSVVVLGELFAGFKAGSKEKGNKELLERFLTKPTVPVTYDTPFAQIPGLRIWDEAGS